ncbi:MAG: CBS domain-containing protein [Myxococcales bacterium]|jgi:CBS domain-containing protein|nr:CBS domain-containing protein [Myxococcales bacterium]
MIAEEVMTTEPVTIDSTATVREALNRMFDAGIRHLPVMNEGDLAGILSDRDLRGLWVPPGSPLGPPVEPSLGEPVGEPVGDESTGDMPPTSSLDQTVGELMSSDVIVASPETDLGEVVDLMLEHRIGAVPVVRPGTHDLVGVVSYVDVLRAARDSL